MQHFSSLFLLLIDEGCDALGASTQEVTSSGLTIEETIKKWHLQHLTGLKGGFHSIRSTENDPSECHLL